MKEGSKSDGTGANVFAAIFTLVFGGLGVGAFLTAVYFFVRFVKWAWSD
jgi:hypothetical protein